MFLAKEDTKMEFNKEEKKVLSDMVNSNIATLDELECQNPKGYYRKQLEAIRKKLE